MPGHTRRERAKKQSRRLKPQRRLNRPHKLSPRAQRVVDNMLVKLASRGTAADQRRALNRVGKPIRTVGGARAAAAALQRRNRALRRQRRRSR